MKTIIQVVPYLPPAIGGVGDYSFLLAQKLRESYQITTHFLIGDPEWKGSCEIDGFFISTIASRTSDALLRALFSINEKHSRKSQCAVFLQYVGYGYAKRGCPIWLLEGLKLWRKRMLATPLLTMFHEHYAFGPPWRSSFWLMLLQRGLVKQLARHSTHILTVRRYTAKIVSNWLKDHGGEVKVLPVFSTIGEPQKLSPLNGRLRRMIIFGGNRKLINRCLLRSLASAIKLFNITEISDIGPFTGTELSRINGVPVTQTGPLPADKVSAIMLDSYAGFFYCPTHCLAKSSIFAAFCAHGLVPITHRYAGDDDGLKAGTHYLITNNVSERVGPDYFQTIADNANRWYQSHNLSTHARVLANLLK